MPLHFLHNALIKSKLKFKDGCLFYFLMPDVFSSQGLFLMAFLNIGLLYSSYFNKLFWRTLTSNKSLWVKWFHGIRIVNYPIWHAQPRSSSHTGIAFLPLEVGSYWVVFTRLAMGGLTCTWFDPPPSYPNSTIEPSQISVIFLVIILQVQLLMGILFFMQIPSPQKRP